MKLPQYYKIIGLIFKIPKEAFEGIYTEKNCPFTSYVSIWGLVLPAVLNQDEAAEYHCHPQRLSPLQLKVQTLREML